MREHVLTRTEPAAGAFWLEAAGLREHWYVACTSRELRRGAVRASKILGLGIVLFRRTDGSVAALVDQCVHRGTALSAGRVVDDRLVCPYHGWCYASDGRVVHVPSVDGARAPERAHRFSQRAFAVRESRGLVWVFPGDSDPDATPVFDMPYHEAPGWTSYYMVSRFEGSVGALAQNFMDVPHTVYVHDKIFRRSTDRLMRTTLELTASSVEVSYADGGDRIGMMPWLTNPRREPLVHTDRFHAPNVTRCDYHWGERSSFVITSQITPLDARSSRVYTLIAYRFPWPGWVARALRPLVHAYTRIVLRQDIRIVRENRRGLDNALGGRSHHVPADAVHLGIERLIDSTRRGEPLAANRLGSRAMDFRI